MYPGKGQDRQIACARSTLMHTYNLGSQCLGHFKKCVHFNFQNFQGAHWNARRANLSAWHAV